MEGMIAVGAVVINRVEASSFPDTIEKVILQPHQFSALSDGQFQLEPDEKAYLAAYRAMQGEDPTTGCLYYYNPSIATAKWSFKRPTIKIIGNHHFTK